MNTSAPNVLRPAAIALAILFAPQVAQAGDMDDGVYHSIRLQIDGTRNDLGGLVNWEGQARIGGDIDKLVARTEGEMQNGHVERSELWALWSRNVADFWDVQTGIREDFDPRPTTSLAAGVQGMLPYFFETDAHAFLSTRGDASARFEQSIDLLLTQRLVLQPHVKMDVYAQDVPELDIGSGVSRIEAGTQLRYEITRRFAPYLDLVYETATGNTARLKRAAGENPGDLTLRAGIRLAF